MPATTATLSSTKAGAKPVVLTLKVHYEMICGQPGLGKAVVSLPDAVVVPSSIDTASVLVDGKPAPAVSTSGHDVSISLPLHHGVSCMVVGPGTLTLTFMRSAGLGNPAKAGTYTIRVQRRTQTFRAKVQISA